MPLSPHIANKAKPLFHGIFFCTSSMKRKMSSVYMHKLSLFSDNVEVLMLLTRGEWYISLKFDVFICIHNLHCHVDPSIGSHYWANTNNTVSVHIYSWCGCFIKNTFYCITFIKAGSLNIHSSTAQLTTKMR